MRLIILSVLIFTTSMLKCQDTSSSFDKAKFLGETEYFENNLTYPKEIGMNQESGNVILSFRLNEDGVLDSIDIVSFTHEVLVNDVAEVLLSTRKKWTPTYLNSKPIPFWYKIVVYYNFLGEVTSANEAKEQSQVSFEKAERLFKKEKYEKALKNINDALNLQPYQSKYYLLRHNIHKALNLTDEAQKDRLAYEAMDKEVIKVVNLNLFGIVREPRQVGGF